MNASPSTISNDVTSDVAAQRQLAACFKALGDELRANLVRVLRRESFGVMELCDIFEVSQPSMSHHLKVLFSAGLLITRREGNSIFYRRASDSGASTQLKALFALIDSLPLRPDLGQRLAHAQHKRNLRCQSFYSENAARFRQQQDLIASYQDYSTALSSVLEGVIQRDSAVDFGAGEGEFALDLAGVFQHVMAMDISRDLLEKARERVSSAGVSNIQFEHLPDAISEWPAPSVDLVSCNMVLHHVASPEGLIATLSNWLTPGGALLLCDLCQHQQEWARESCGDLWLGFAEAELNSWTRAAGLTLLKEEYLSLRNGFRVQVLLFEKAGHPAVERK